MTEPRDELLERYADAVAQDPRRPSDRVRHAARAHAQMLRDQATAVQRVEGNAPNKPAANQSQWTVSLVASLAVVGLAGLIFVQIDRGTPDVREAGLGTVTRNEAPTRTTQPVAPSPVATPPVAIAVAPTKSVAANVARVAKTPSPAPAPTPPVQTPVESTGNMAKALSEAATEPAEANMASKTDKKIMENYAGAAAPREARTRVIADSATRAAPSTGPQAPAPAAPAAMAPPAPAPAPVIAAAAAPPGTPLRTHQMDAATPVALYLEAARTGNTDAIQKLLSQGVAVDVRDAAGNTALMVAVRHRQPSTVRMLLAMGADTRLTNQEGITALQLANQLGLADMAQLLQTPR